MKKTRSVELATFDRFLEDMAQVLDIPRSKLDKMVFQDQAKTVRKITQPRFKKRNMPPRASAR